MSESVPSATVRAICYLTALAGAVALAAALLVAPLQRGDLWALLALAAIAWPLMHFPYQVAPRNQTTIEELALCVSLFLFPFSVLVPAIVAAYVVSAFLKRTAFWRLTFNAGIRGLAATLALLLVVALDFGAQPITAQMGIALAAAALYLFTADLAVSWLWSLRTGEWFWPSLHSSLRAGAGPWFVAGGSGVVIALAAGATPWVIPVGVIGAGLVISGSRGRYRYREEGRRLRSLHLAGQALNGASRRDEVEKIAARAAGELVAAAGAKVQTFPPGNREHGVRLPGAGSWLVVPQRDHAVLTFDDRETLAALASMTESALGRLELVAELERQSLEDHLTGAGNRRRFESILHELVGGDDERFALVLFDVDLFKEINDEFGHEAGDRSLVALAEAVKASFRPQDLLFRLGGDEFVLLLPNVTAQQAAERVTVLQERVADRGPADRNSTSDLPGLRISVGIAEFPGAAESPESLLRLADKALYRAKREGGNEIFIAGGEDRWLAPVPPRAGPGGRD